MSAELDAWVENVAVHADAERVHVCTGDDRELTMLELEAARRDAGAEHNRRDDVATIISDRSKGEIRRKRDLVAREAATHLYWSRLHDSMRRQTLYSVPYVLGHPDASWAEAGVTLTDDPRLALALVRRVRVGQGARGPRGCRAAGFVRSVHASLADGPAAICTFAESRTILAVGVSAQAFLAAHAHTLRLATSVASAQDRLPVRMAVIEVSLPDRSERRLRFGVVAPADIGRAQVALLGSPKRGTSYRVLAEVAWLVADPDGGLVALLPERSPHEEPCGSAPGSASVRLDALVLCARRATTLPLVLEIPGWAHACYAASMLVTDPAAEVQPMVDPMGMRSFCGCDLTEYVDRWLALGPRLRKPPRVFQLNWFRRGEGGGLVWPGFSEGWRVVDWMIARLEGRAHVRATVAGFVPEPNGIERTDLPLPDETWQALLDVDPDRWRSEVVRHAAALAGLGRTTPLELHREHRHFAERIDEIAGRMQRRT